MKQSKIRFAWLLALLVLLIILGIYFVYRLQIRKTTHFVSSKLDEMNVKDSTFGIIEGELNYGGSHIPPDLEFCAENIINKNLYCTLTHIYPKDYKSEFDGSYQIRVPTGIYYVFHKAPAKGWFSLKKEVITYFNCDDTTNVSEKSKVEIKVSANKKVTGVTPWAFPCSKNQEFELSTNEKSHGIIEAEWDMSKVNFSPYFILCAENTKSGDLYCTAPYNVKRKTKTVNPKFKLDLILGTYNVNVKKKEFAFFEEYPQVGSEEWISTFYLCEKDKECKNNKPTLVTLSKEKGRWFLNLDYTIRKLRKEQKKFKLRAAKRQQVFFDCDGCRGIYYYVSKDEMDKKGINWLKTIFSFLYSVKGIEHPNGTTIYFEHAACGEKKIKEIEKLILSNDFIKWSGNEVIRGIKDFIDKLKNLPNHKKFNKNIDAKEYLLKNPIVKEYMDSRNRLFKLLKKKFNIQEGSLIDTC